MRQQRLIQAVPGSAPPLHRRPEHGPPSGVELDALLARARTLRARALLAIWLRLRRQVGRGLSGRLHGPATQHRPPLFGRRCRAS